MDKQRCFLFFDYCVWQQQLQRRGKYFSINFNEPSVEPKLCDNRLQLCFPRTEHCAFRRHLNRQFQHQIQLQRQQLFRKPPSYKPNSQRTLYLQPDDLQPGKLESRDIELKLMELRLCFDSMPFVPGEWVLCDVLQFEHQRVLRLQLGQQQLHTGLQFGQLLGQYHLHALQLKLQQVFRHQHALHCVSPELLSRDYQLCLRTLVLGRVLRERTERLLRPMQLAVQHLRKHKLELPLLRNGEVPFRQRMPEQLPSQ